MSRLSSWIVRSEEPVRISRRGSGRAIAVAGWEAPQPFAGTEPGQWLDELKLFATGWIGGLIFFGTYLS